jgi:hypothetical protein
MSSKQARKIFNFHSAFYLDISFLRNVIRLTLNVLLWIRMRWFYRTVSILYLHAWTLNFKIPMLKKLLCSWKWVYSQVLTIWSNGGERNYVKSKNINDIHVNIWQKTIVFSCTFCLMSILNIFQTAYHNFLRNYCIMLIIYYRLQILGLLALQHGCFWVYSSKNIDVVIMYVPCL